MEKTTGYASIDRPSYKYYSEDYKMIYYKRKENKHGLPNIQNNGLY